MKRKRYYLKTIIAGVLFGAPLFAMDVATYYDIDIKSMQISIESSKKVLKLLQSGATLEEQYATIDETQERHRRLFASVGLTPSKHAGYYMKHQKEVREYYEYNATLQEKYTQLQTQLENINKKIQTIREAQQ